MIKMIITGIQVIINPLNDNSDYNFSSARDLNDYSNHDSTGVYVENVKYEDMKMVSICGKDIEYEDDKIYKNGGEFVDCNEDGHMTSIDRDDVNYGSDGIFLGWGSENIEYGENDPYLYNLIYFL